MRGIRTEAEVRCLFEAFDGCLVAVVDGVRKVSVFLGRPGEPLRELPVTKTRVFRDGGTTEHDTDEGILRIPAGRDPRDQVPTWKGDPVSEVPDGGYQATLGETCVVTLSPAPVP